MILSPLVRLMTVSGVDSICSIRSEFKTTDEWFNRVTWIISHPRPHIGDGPANFETLLAAQRIVREMEKIARYTVYMTVSRPSAAELAAALLRAWLRAEPDYFNFELGRYTAPPQDEFGAEGEQQMLLNAIAHRICECPNPFAGPAEDPGLDLCIRLLLHMVSQNGCRA